MPIFRMSIIILLAVAIMGCAGLCVNTIGSDQKADKKAEGFRYYQPAPFLFIYSDGKGGLTSQIKYLPDTTQKMSAEPYAYLATIETTLQFDAGMLTQASAVADETAVPVAALDSLAKVLGTAAKAAIALNMPTEINEKTVPVPYLFKIIVKGNTVELNGGPTGGAAMSQDKKKIIIKVTIAKQGS